ncbi:unnamed protein product [Penicillium salamii]|nr:unnamed protein product [Penicillium salamii]
MMIDCISQLAPQNSANPLSQSQFDFLAHQKDQKKPVNSYMASHGQDRPMWFDIYPVQRLMGDATPFGGPFLVDVGGNQGHDLIQFGQKFKYLPGKLILQDLPNKLSRLSGHDLGIEIMPHNFMDPQPVKGARVYYFRSIFHDLSDEVCHQILRSTISAMAHDYSRIMIVDFVLPDTDTPLTRVTPEIQKEGIRAGVGRSKSQWRELLQNAGLEVTGIWNQDAGMESVIEAIPLSSMTS